MGSTELLSLLGQTTKEAPFFRLFFSFLEGVAVRHISAMVQRAPWVGAHSLRLAGSDGEGKRGGGGGGCTHIPIGGADGGESYGTDENPIGP